MFHLALAVAKLNVKKCRKHNNSILLSSASQNSTRCLLNKIEKQRAIKNKLDEKCKQDGNLPKMMSQFLIVDFLGLWDFPLPFSVVHGLFSWHLHCQHFLPVPETIQSNDFITHSKLAIVPYIVKCVGKYTQVFYPMLHTPREPYLVNILPLREQALP